MLHREPLKAANEPVGSSRWHRLRDHFRGLFLEDQVAVIEDWYNRVAPQRHRESFRTVCKGILAVEPKPSGDAPAADSGGRVELESHRAAHMVQLYGAVLSPKGRARTQRWLEESPPAQVDKFRDVFTSLGKALASQTTTKESFVLRPVTDPITGKKWNRQKIDWNSEKVGDAMRATADDPMAGTRERHLLPDIIPSGASVGATYRQTDNIGAGVLARERRARTAGAEQAPNQTSSSSALAQHAAAAQLRAQQQGSDGVYAVHDGCTVFQPRSRKALEKTSERVVVSFGTNTTATWKSTTRDHIKNHGHVRRDVVAPDQHPAISRLTASLGLVVPTLEPAGGPPPSL